MTRNEIVDYMTDDTARTMSDVERDITVIAVAQGYGFDLTPDEHEAYWVGLARYGYMPNVDSDDGYVGNLDADISTVAAMATRYLNDNGIVPRASDHGHNNDGAGYGTPRRGDAARLYGAAWVTA